MTFLKKREGRRSPPPSRHLEKEEEAHLLYRQGQFKGSWEESSTVAYQFTGKLALFPLTILFLAVGAGFLLNYGKKPYLHGYFHSQEMYYGIAGLTLAILALGFCFALMLKVVLKVSFTINTEAFVVHKHGVLRSSTLEFATSNTSLHYFRTHFSENQAWLQLVVKEGNQFYQIFSWKGNGNQRERFLKLFVTLQKELMKWQARTQTAKIKNWTSTEIVSKKEVNLISPFRHRLKILLGDLQERKSAKFLQARSDTALCIEDIPVINYDHFLRHFSCKKFLAPRSVSNKL
ncbi:hypothetical protein QOT17_019539 [Balamuthia mandrillaris]